MSNHWHNVLYVGVSNSLEHRVTQHKAGLVPGFTKKYNTNELVYFEEFTEITLAIRREKQLKSWTRAKKNALVEAMNPDWKDLAQDLNESIYRCHPERSEGSAGT